MNHVTSIGLDVHARSITGAAFNPITGKIVTRKFGASPAEVAEWILSFESRKKHRWSEDVPLRIENHAARGVKRLIDRRRHLHQRGKKPCVANCATARELACWVWALGRMSEGTLD